MNQHPTTTLPHPLRVLLAGFAVLLASVDAEAQVRYVAATGRDANPCTTAPAPCKTLQRGIDVTPAGGEVRVLSSGAYGAATITKSLTVSADDSVTIGGQITINSAGATVVLRGLNLNGTGLANEGIYVPAAKVVHIEHCEVERFGGHGIYLAAQNAEFTVSDTVSRDNTNAGLVLYDSAASPTTFGSIRLTVDNSRFDNNGDDGMLLSGGTIKINRVALVGNGAHGLVAQFSAIDIFETVAARNHLAEGFAFAFSKATVDSSVSEGNTSGLDAFGDPASVTMSNSILLNNIQTGISEGGAGVWTLRDNTIVDNSTNVYGTLTPLQPR